MADLNLQNLPVELLLKIFTYCDVKSLCRLSITCKVFRDNLQSDFVWKKKFVHFSDAKGIEIPHNSFACVRCYRDAVRRLWCVYRGTTVHAWRCSACDKQLCDIDCIVNWKFAFVLDFGGKTSWAKYIDEEQDRMVLRTHPSLVACPKLPENISDPRSSRNLPIVPECFFCRSGDRMPLCDAYYDELLDRRATSPKTVLENIIVVDDDDDDGNNAMVDEEIEDIVGFQVPRQASVDVDTAEHELPIRNYVSLHSVQEEMEIISKDSETSYQFKLIPPITQYGIRHPAVMEFFIRHLMSMVRRDLDELQVWNVPVIMCEPILCSRESRRELLRILFEKLKVQRVCLIEKPRAISLYAGRETCLVVDSGAFHTVVAPIVKHALNPETVQHKPVGGYYVAQYLAQCIETSNRLEKVTVGSLDAKRVKSECYLAYNITREESKSHKPKTVYVRSAMKSQDKNVESRGGESSELHGVSLSTELYMAPESMYQTLGLPQMILDAVAYYPLIKRDLLSNVTLTGGNTQLRGFANRLLFDLRSLCPEDADFINVSNANSLSARSDVVIGASYIRGVPQFAWKTREDYILYGADARGFFC